MGLFRRSALTAVGGWNEWCICEDTEASLRVTKDGWSGLYIPRCFGRGVVPPSFAGMLTQRHRWCFGAMQILRLHWRSLMPWDRSPDNHLTAAQRRDYLMASLGWFRDLLMLAFSLLLLVIAGLLGHPIQLLRRADGRRPLAASVVAHHHRHRLHAMDAEPLDDPVLSASAAVAGHQPLGHLGRRARLHRRGGSEDGVFLRTSKAGGRRNIFTALRLTQVETILAVALFAAAGFLAASGHRPWLLVFIIVFQGCVYLCGPIASVWNLWAQGVPGHGIPAALRRTTPACRAPPTALGAVAPACRRGPDRPVRRGRDERFRASRVAAAYDGRAAVSRIPRIAAGRAPMST